jgi:hypothetical protein
MNSASGLEPKTTYLYFVHMLKDVRILEVVFFDKKTL